MEQLTLASDFRHFIPTDSDVVTEAAWVERDRLADRYYPQIMDLLRFDEDHLLDILMDVESEKKPAQHFPVGPAGSPRPLAWLPKRSWLEWHLFRGIAPAARRPAISQAIRAAVLARDGLVCQLCGGDVELGDVHLDHVKPFSKGGPTTVQNLQVAHSTCNIRKGNRA